MKKIDPFQHYSSKLIAKLQRSKKEKNPALWLYKNGLRTEAFMLESLYRLFEKAFAPDYEDGNKLFKKLEDALGQIDFYDVFYQDFKTNKKIDQEAKTYILKKKEKSLKRFEKLLTKKDGLENRIRELDKFIQAQKLNFERTAIKSIEVAIQKEITDIKRFVKETDGDFTNVEEELHEVRRKLRWLSIYGQSLQGVIKLEDNGKKEGWIKKYVSKDIVSLPFNKLPLNSFPAHVLYRKNNFYALSRIIFELGILKDTGFRLEFLAKVIRKVEKIDSEAAMKKAEIALAVKENEVALLKHASRLLDEFLNQDKILDGLVIKSPAKKTVTRSTKVKRKV
jgi:hypothetical protein